ncbi:alpha-1,2-fucosyltransferase [Geotalea sp. SG265]|uniref:alpha-1,2-fucosyltransferase n=1 Tax=Geotalea sp. SG265 TaxID=2922867 RepID=UPI001FAF9ED3
MRLAGGLGNQMFQYAAAKRLADYRNTELKLDISCLNSCIGGTARPFQLKHLAITVPIATPREIAKMTGDSKRVVSAVSRVCRSLGLGCHPGIYTECFFHFDPAVLSLPDDTLLVGYWQSEKYFKDIGEMIRREFSPIISLEGKDKEIAEHIQAENSVSLHVRRGDYIADADVNAVHGVCSVDYYMRSIEIMKGIVACPHVFVFSDDPSWVIENLQLPCPSTVIQHNTTSQEAHLDLRLMSLCKHHIIANSSFSWWGAWLSENPGKLVIAPRKWFNNPSLDISDLLPSDWLKL